MSGGRDEGTHSGAGDEKAGKRESPVGDAQVDGAESEESGYRRDDYWREEAREDGVGPSDVPEPSQGYAFESAEEKAKADGEADTPADDDDGPGAEQGNAGGRDDARIVED